MTEEKNDRCYKWLMLAMLAAGLSTGVRIYDQVKPSASALISLADLPAGQISAENIKLYHLNSAGYVDCIVLDNLTGSAYQYGICHLEEGEEDRFLTLSNGTAAGIERVATPIHFRDGEFYGVSLGADGKVKSVVGLEVLKGVSPSAFYTDLSGTYLRHNGVRYAVSEDVVCYKTANKLWLTNPTGAERLAACRAFSDSLSVYFDPFVGQVRIVTAD